MSGFSQFFGVQSLGDVSRFLEQGHQENSVDHGSRVNLAVGKYVDEQRNAALTNLAYERLDDLAEEAKSKPSELAFDFSVLLEQPGKMTASDILAAQEKMAQLTGEHIMRFKIFDRIASDDPKLSGYGDELLEQAIGLVEIEQLKLKGADSSLRMMQFSLAVHSVGRGIHGLSVEDTPQAFLTQNGAELDLSADVLTKSVKGVVEKLAHAEGISNIPVFSPIN